MNFGWRYANYFHKANNNTKFKTFYKNTFKSFLNSKYNLNNLKLFGVNSSFNLYLLNKLHKVNYCQIQSSDHLIKTIAPSNNTFSSIISLIRDNSIKDLIILLTKIEKIDGISLENGM